MHNKETCKVIGCGTCDTTASKLLRDFSKNKCTLDVCREHKGMMCSQCKEEMETWEDRFDKLIVKDYVIDVHGGLVEMYQDDLRKFIANEVSLAYAKGRTEALK